MADRGGLMGRKPKPEAERLEVVPLRLNAEQRAKLVRLGGAQWVRDRIDRARVPESVQSPAAKPRQS